MTVIYLDIFAILISLLVILVTYFKWSFTYWKRREVYTAPPSIPFGNALNIFKKKNSFGAEIKNVYADIKSKGKGYGGFYFFSRPIFIPVDLDLVKQILTTDFAHFTNHANYVNEERDPLTGHLFGLKGSKWKTLRNKLNPTFTSGKIKMMFRTLINCSNELVEVVNNSIKQNKPLDTKDIMARFSTDVIGSCGFGIECNSLKNPNSKFRQYGQKTFEPSLYNTITRLLTLGAPRLLGLLRIPIFNKDLTNFFLDIVKQTVTFRETNSIVRQDFMHLLIQLKNNVNIVENEIGNINNSKEAVEKVNETSISLSLSQITAQAFVFFVAGFETSSTTLTFCLFELVQNPKCQDKVREEIHRVLEKYGGELTYDSAMEMIYMEKCINETLRKYPPVPIHTRECTETYKVPNSNLVLEKGLFVIIPALGIHYDPEFHPNPEKFDPERFSEKNKSARHSAAWAPFGDGPRICIGLKFGVMQIKVALAALLKNFKFSLNSKTEVPLKLDPRSFVPTAEKGIWLNAENI